VRNRIHTYLERHPNVRLVLITLLAVSIPLMDLGRIRDSQKFMVSSDWLTSFLLGTLLGIAFALPMVVLITAAFLPRWSERVKKLKWIGGIWTVTWVAPFLLTHPRHEDLALTSPALLGIAVFTDSAFTAMLASVVALAVVRRHHPAFRGDAVDGRNLVDG
jgi:hypothetical protein